MTDLGTYFAMGGYAVFVWPAYAVAALILAGLLVASLRRLGADERAVKALEQARPRRRPGPAGPDRRTRPVGAPGVGV